MKNEVVIKPLREFEVHLQTYDVFGDNEPAVEKFTADTYEVINNQRVQFLRTGNVVREYFSLPRKVIITPVDEQVPE